MPTVISADEFAKGGGQPANVIPAAAFASGGGVVAPAGATEAPASPKEKKPQFDVVQEQHPDLPNGMRFKLEALSTQNPKMAKEVLASLGFEAADQDGQIILRKPGESQWKVVDPNVGAYLHMPIGAALKEAGKDITELVPGALTGLGEYASARGGAALGAQLGSRLGPVGTAVGAGLGAMGGGALAGGTLETARQMIGKATGLPQEVDPEKIKEEALLGAIPGVIEAPGAARAVLKEGAAALAPSAGVMAPKALNASFKNKATSFLSGVPVDTLEDVNKYPGRYLKLEQDRDLLRKKAQDVGQTIIDLAEKNRKNLGDQIGSIIKSADESGTTVDFSRAKATLQNEIAGTKEKLAGPYASDADQSWLDALKELQDKVFSRRIAGEKGPAYALLEDDLPASVVKQKTDALKQFIDYNKNLTQMAQNQSQAAAAGNMGKFASELRSGLKEQLHSLDPRYADLDSQYAEALTGRAELENKLKTGGQINAQKALDSLRNIDTSAKQSFSSEVNKLAGPEEAKKINRLIQDVRNQMYLRNPSLQQISTGAATSTSASGAAQSLGEALGATAGSKMGLGYGGIVGLRKIGGLAVQNAYSPERLRALIDERRAAAAARRGLEQSSIWRRLMDKPTLYGASVAGPKINQMLGPDILPEEQQ